MDFWTIVTAVIWLMLAASALLVVWFVYNTSKSVADSAAFSKAFKDQGLNHHMTLQERYDALPVVPSPIQSYSRGHSRFALEDIPTNDPQYLLDRFAAVILATDNPRLFCAKPFPSESPGRLLKSIVVGYQATPFTRFLGWMVLENVGTHIEAHLMCSEVRMLWTPPELDSHFEYGPDQVARQTRRREEQQPGMFEFVGQGLFHGYMSAENGKHAKWFQRFIAEMWQGADVYAQDLSLDEPRTDGAERLPSAEQRSLGSTNAERKRPSRRD